MPVMSDIPRRSAWCAAALAACIDLVTSPRSGRPGGKWRQVAVRAPGAALADALSTALCLLPEEKIVHIRQVWPDAKNRLLPVV